jgi:hypothetical protein
MCALRNRQSFQNGPMLTIYSQHPPQPLRHERGAPRMPLGSTAGAGEIRRCVALAPSRPVGHAVLRF